VTGIENAYPHLFGQEGAANISQGSLQADIEQ